MTTISSTVFMDFIWDSSSHPGRIPVLDTPLTTCFFFPTFRMDFSTWYLTNHLFLGSQKSQVICFMISSKHYNLKLITSMQWKKFEYFGEIKECNMPSFSTQWEHIPLPSFLTLFHEKEPLGNWDKNLQKKYHHSTVEISLDRSIISWFPVQYCTLGTLFINSNLCPLNCSPLYLQALFILQVESLRSL